MNKGKEKLIQILKAGKYYNFNNIFYIEYAIYNGTKCNSIVINDKVNIYISIDKKDNIKILGADRVDGSWYDINNSDCMEYLEKIYSYLAA